MIPNPIKYTIGFYSTGQVVSDLVVISKENLTPAEFSGLADVPPEIEWLANITNDKTRRAYKNDVQEFDLPWE